MLKMVSTDTSGDIAGGASKASFLGSLQKEEEAS